VTVVSSRSDDKLCRGREAAKMKAAHDLCKRETQKEKR
jgi:hypothetical protein